MKRRLAVLSDIHSNLQALRAVLLDVRRLGLERVVCLGDVVGYGGNPKEVIDVVREFAFTIQGNHDEAVALCPPDDFHPLAARAVRWTRAGLKPHRASGVKALRRWTFLTRRLPPTVREGPLLFAHGSPASNFEYVDDLGTAAEVLSARPRGVQAVFVGHTHVPGVYACTARGMECFQGNGTGDLPPLGSCPMVVNPGSVGQPRDGDPRASYMAVVGDRMVTRRVDYDVEAAASAIYRRRELPDEFGHRLFIGR
ncbi:MAG: metallophosphoesterase family protein [Planctomycetes bacterium]|nr:metallophosphoesterase family protein [Planctomycetota bacterium]